MCENRIFAMKLMERINAAREKDGMSSLVLS
jgi:hypothetical protein